MEGAAFPAVKTITNPKQVNPRQINHIANLRVLIMAIFVSAIQVLRIFQTHSLPQINALPDGGV
jgi:hypothetical protein